MATLDDAPEETGAKKKGVSEKVITEQIERIKELKTVGASEAQILNVLKITRPALHRRMKRLNDMNRKVMYDAFKGDILSEVYYLEQRMLRTIQNCEAIARSDNPVVTATEKLAAERLKVEVAIALVKLKNEGPMLLGSTTANAIVSGQQELHNKLGELGMEHDTESPVYYSDKGKDIIP